MDGLPPVFYAPSLDYYVVTRYADVEAVFLDHESYSAAAAQLPPPVDRPDRCVRLSCLESDT